MPKPEEIVADMTRQYDAWVAAGKPGGARRGAWYRGRGLGDPRGATNLKATEVNSANRDAAKAGFRLEDSRSGGLSWHKGNFIYHAQLPPDS
jgi:hypothetical protein